MAITAIDICSKALLFIGANAIQSFDDGSRESAVCSSIYETVKDTLLSNRLWCFSIEQLDLARLNKSPLRDWKYVYALPSNVLRIKKEGLKMAIDIKEEIANYLLNNCFLIGNVDSTREKYYYVINHEESFRQLFQPIGYTLVSYILYLYIISILIFKGGFFVIKFLI